MVSQGIEFAVAELLVAKHQRRLQRNARCGGFKNIGQAFAPDQVRPVGALQNIRVGGAGVRE